jgi:hypothetical protein
MEEESGKSFAPAIAADGSHCHLTIIAVLWSDRTDWFVSYDEEAGTGSKNPVQ